MLFFGLLLVPQFFVVFQQTGADGFRRLLRGSGGRGLNGAADVVGFSQCFLLRWPGMPAMLRSRRHIERTNLGSSMSMLVNISISMDINGG